MCARHQFRIAEFGSFGRVLLDHGDNRGFILLRISPERVIARAARVARVWPIFARIFIRLPCREVRQVNVSRDST